MGPPIPCDDAALSSSNGGDRALQGGSISPVELRDLRPRPPPNPAPKPNGRRERASEVGRPGAAAAAVAVVRVRRLERRGRFSGASRRSQLQDKINGELQHRNGRNYDIIHAAASEGTASGERRSTANFVFLGMGNSAICKIVGQEAEGNRQS